MGLNWQEDWLVEEMDRRLAGWRKSPKTPTLSSRSLTPCPHRPEEIDERRSETGGALRSPGNAAP
jgi:hypothetical protein